MIRFNGQKKIFWAIASAFIAILSIWIKLSHRAKHFRFEILMSFIRNATRLVFYEFCFVRLGLFGLKALLS